MARPKLLDLFCCAGGAGVGYERAGFDVFSADIDAQPNNPFPFYQGDALALLQFQLNFPEGRSLFRGRDGSQHWLCASDFAARHASPPCQDYTALKAVHGNQWPRLIEPTRELLDQFETPYVLENVQGAPVRRDLILCGEMFSLGVIRHRYFELGGWTAEPIEHVRHRGRVAGWRHGEYFDGPYFAVYGEGGGKGTVQQWQVAMGIDWTSDRRELAEAIPPAYTEFIGAQLLSAVASTEAEGRD